MAAIPRPTRPLVPPPAAYLVGASAVSKAETSNSSKDALNRAKLLCDENVRFFEQRPIASNEKLAAVFRNLSMAAETISLLCEPLKERAESFDPAPNVQANGVRSILQVVDSLADRISTEGTMCSKGRSGVLFSPASILEQLEASLKSLRGLGQILMLANTLLEVAEPGELHVDKSKLPDNIMHEVEEMPRGCFYGRNLGFQYASSVRPIMRSVIVAMASFGEGYRRHDIKRASLRLTASSLFHGAKHVVSPELCLKNILVAIRGHDIQFTKAFWSLSELNLMQYASGVLGSPTVNVLFAIPPGVVRLPRISNTYLQGEPLACVADLFLADSESEVAIPPPISPSGRPANVTVRLISSVARQGQPKKVSSLARSSQRAPLSRGLIIHFHGGGFVAQTSKSHCVYLRRWAQDLGVPILSVDYSLSPEHPYPRAICDCFYAYAWAIRYASSLLGTTAERVVLAGDSAGGNFAVTISLLAAAYGVRVPDGIMAAYPALLVDDSPSPSRLLSVLDPLLPTGILMACLKAYATPAEGANHQGSTDEKTGNQEAESVNDGTASSWSISSLPGVKWTLDRLPSQPAWQWKSTGGQVAGSSHPSFPSQEDLEEMLRLHKKQQKLLGEWRFISPLKLTDDLLRTLPHCDILPSKLDPLLDDSIAFAKRTSALGCDVQVHPVDVLPHGFLNLLGSGLEARQACELSMDCMRNVLHVDVDAPSPAGSKQSSHSIESCVDDEPETESSADPEGGPAASCTISSKEADGDPVARCADSLNETD